MMPTMTYFREALSAPTLHFKRLRVAEPILCDDAIIVRRTYTAIETEITIEGRHFLLYLPFNRASIDHIMQLESTAQERSRGPLIENHILGEELTLYNSLGLKHTFDVVLQEMPSGMILKEAIHHYCADDLTMAIRRMKERMDAIGFRHNNLNPSNIIICDSGVARPLRYWYAEWELFSDNDISQLLDFIDHNCYNKSAVATTGSEVRDCEGEYNTKQNSFSSITRVRKGRYYGFVDSDGNRITPFIYLYASDFREGRAIVAKNKKMGVIDNNGRKIIPEIYKHIEFDVEAGIFTAINDRFRYHIDYEGEIIQRILLEDEAQYGTNIEV